MSLIQVESDPKAILQEDWLHPKPFDDNFRYGLQTIFLAEGTKLNSQCLGLPLNKDLEYIEVENLHAKLPYRAVDIERLVRDDFGDQNFVVKQILTGIIGTASKHKVFVFAGCISEPS